MTATNIQSWKKSLETIHLNTTERPLSALNRSDRCNRPVRPVCKDLHGLDVDQTVRPVAKTGQTGPKQK